MPKKMEQSHILSQGQLWQRMKELPETAGLASYSDGVVTFFIAHGTAESWVRKLHEQGFVECIYRRYPGTNGVVTTAKALLETFYSNVIVIYDIDVLEEYLGKFIINGQQV